MTAFEELGVIPQVWIWMFSGRRLRLFWAWRGGVSAALGDSNGDSVRGHSCYSRRWRCAYCESFWQFLTELFMHEKFWVNENSTHSFFHLSMRRVSHVKMYALVLFLLLFFPTLSMTCNIMRNIRSSKQNYSFISWMNEWMHRTTWE